MTVITSQSKTNKKSCSEKESEADSATLGEYGTELSLDRLLTSKESAKFLNISEPTFWRHVRDGRLPKPIKFGHLSRWPRSELMTVIERAKSAREAV